MSEPDAFSTHVRRTFHGFIDWVEFIKAVAWMVGIIGSLFIASMYYVLDARYVQVAEVRTLAADLKCEGIVGRIDTLETQLIIANAKLARATEQSDKLDLADEIRVLAGRIREERQRAADLRCPIVNN